MKWILAVLALFFITPQLRAQENEERMTVYKIWVKKMDGTKLKGIFYEASDAGVTLDVAEKKAQIELVTVAPEDISTLKFRKNGVVWKWALIAFIK